MKCSIHRWNISRALDSGEPLAGPTKHHLGHCEACREFLQLSEEMGRRLADDAALLLSDERPGLNRRVKNALDETRKAAPISADSRPQLLRMRPILAAALLVTLAATGLFFLLMPRPDRTAQVSPPLKIESPKVYLQSAWQKAESKPASAASKTSRPRPGIQTFLE